MAQMRHAGPCDTALFFNTYLSEEPLYSDLMFTNIHAWPFVEGSWERRDVPTMVNLATMGRWFLHHGSIRVPSDDLVYTVVIGELLAPCLPGGMILDMNASRMMLARAVRALIYDNDQLQRYTDGTRADFLLEVAAINAAQGQNEIPIGNAFHGISIDPDLPNGMILPSENDWPEVAPAVISVGSAIKILYYLARRITNRGVRGGMACIVHIVLAIVKRGTVSGPFITKIIKGIRDDIGKDVDINSAVLPMIYRVYGTLIDDIRVREIFDRWGGQIPAVALRLRLTIQQAAGGGLTAYLTIVKAVRNYQTFNWAKVSLLLPDDWAKFMIAYVAVGNNAYYGFRKDIGPAKSTNFKSLSYVAKELLSKVGGDNAIGRYAGWVNRIPHQAEIDRMIADYEEERAAAVTDDMVEELNEDRDFAAFLNQVRDDAYGNE